MLFQPQVVTELRRNNFQASANPEQRNLSASRFNSPSLKLGAIRSWKFVYRSPTKVEQAVSQGPLAFNKQAHKLTIRKLPKFNEEILENDPLKNSKIIENINFFREQQKRKLGLGDSQANTAERSRVSDNNFEVSKVLVDLRNSTHPNNLRMSRSLSCSYKVLESSRMSVVDQLKSGECLYQSLIRNEGPIMESRVIQLSKSPSKINLAESRYFANIIGK